jgi:FtsZ-interacting cell division protein ZipA
MLGIIIIVLIGSISCVLVGYLIYNIWINRMRKRKIGIDMTINRNASSRRRRSTKKKVRII